MRRYKIGVTIVFIILILVLISFALGYDIDGDGIDDGGQDLCGDGFCQSDLGENITSCSNDCNISTEDAYCGDGVCSDSEDCSIDCESDLEPGCGNLVCDIGEEETCPEDCGVEEKFNETDNLERSNDSLNFNLGYLILGIVFILILGIVIFIFMMKKKNNRSESSSSDNKSSLVQSQQSVKVQQNNIPGSVEYSSTI